MLSSDEIKDIYRVANNDDCLFCKSEGKITYRIEDSLGNITIETKECEHCKEE